MVEACINAFTDTLLEVVEKKNPLSIEEMKAFAEVVENAAP